MLSIGEVESVGEGPGGDIAEEAVLKFRNLFKHRLDEPVFSLLEGNNKGLVLLKQRTVDFQILRQMVEINIVVGEEICKVIVAPVVMHISYHNRFDGVSCGLVSHISVGRTAIFMQGQAEGEGGIYRREGRGKLISDGKPKFGHPVHTLLRMAAGAGLLKQDPDGT